MNVIYGHVRNLPQNCVLAQNFNLNWYIASELTEKLRELTFPGFS